MIEMTFDQVLKAALSLHPEQKAILIKTLEAPPDVLADPTRAQLIAELEALRATGAFDHVTSLRNQYPAPALENVSDEQLLAAIREVSDESVTKSSSGVRILPAADLEAWTGLIAVGGDALEDSRRVYGE